MELVPRHADRPLPRRIAAATSGVVLVWLLAVIVLPAVLGLRSQVLPLGEEQGYAAGTVVVTRDAPTSDVSDGDVIDLSPSAATPDLREVVETRPGLVVLRPVHRGDAPAQEVMTADLPTSGHVALTVPYVGLPLTVLPDWAEWVLLSVLLALTVVLGAVPRLRARRERRRTSARWASRSVG